ncbi:MAG TPA: DUF3658 domain-containing protein [Steroidobacteraceae bacterium]|jgi:hypothetical protein|nr:DUF3658 domain-containing protein [Steroidobacteraceae bacterium]
MKPVTPMTSDDGKRPQVGVLVTLRDLGDGKTRMTLDDVKSGSTRRETHWTFDVFVTHKDLDTAAVEAMQLSSAEYEGLGATIMARLLALTGRSSSNVLEVDDELSSEAEARAALLTPKEIAQIDAALMSHTGNQWRKLAMVVALAMADCEEAIEGVSDAFYSRRAAKLVSDGYLVANGDLRRIRYCEVKRP